MLFAHGSGSSRHSPRNQFVARTLNDAGLATLLFDLLTPEEEAIDMQTRRAIGSTSTCWPNASFTRQSGRSSKSQTCDLRIGYFGSSTGGAAALVAAVGCFRRM